MLFIFHSINESRFLRFLKLLNCDNGDVGNFSGIINSRNKSAHSNGIISFSSQPEIDNKISKVLSHIQKIQTLSKPIIKDCFVDFLKSSWNVDKREYLDDADQIREILVHKHYLSQKDINLLRSNFQISTLAGEANFKEIKSLFTHLRKYTKLTLKQNKTTNKFIIGQC